MRSQPASAGRETAIWSSSDNAACAEPFTRCNENLKSSISKRSHLGQKQEQILQAKSVELTEAATT
jgi:hypothetical protein